MTVMVAFLRGINLGPTNKVSMPRLREVLAEHEFEDVRTYINSGNVIVSSSKAVADVEAEIGAVLKSEFAVRCDVTVRTAAQLRDILERNPYPEGHPSKVNVAFCLKPANVSTAKTRMSAVATEREVFEIAGSEIYVHYGDGLGTSKLAREFSSIVGVSATVRTIGTVGKLVAMLPDD